MCFSRASFPMMVKRVLVGRSYEYLTNCLSPVRPSSDPIMKIWSMKSV